MSTGMTSAMGSEVNGTATGGSAAGSMTAADAGACASRGYEIQQLAARVAGCADRADAVLAQLVRLEMTGWQSPAGRAYRTALSLQAASLRRGRTALENAVAVVLRHARNVMQPSGGPGS